MEAEESIFIGLDAISAAAAAVTEQQSLADINTSFNYEQPHSYIQPTNGFSMSSLFSHSFSATPSASISNSPTEQLLNPDRYHPTEDRKSTRLNSSH